MSIVKEKTEKVLQRCQECPLHLTRKKVEADPKSFDILESMDIKVEANTAVEGVMKLSCNLCPYREQFEKIFKEKPYDYFFRKK